MESAAGGWATYGFVNQPANLCLDDYGWGATNDMIADLWKCSGDNGVPPQHWILQ